tara:strand:+ start:59 stop:505 length:447 start_codon:yes stop_codon:yes gene_type:complete
MAHHGYMRGDRPVVKIAKAIKAKVKQHKEDKSKRVEEASKRLKERNINPSGLKPSEILRLNKKITKSDVRSQTTSAMEEFQKGRADIKEATGPKVDVDITGSVGSSSSSSSSSSSTSSSSKPSETGRSDLERSKVLLMKVKNPQKNYE